MMEGRRFKVRICPFLFLCVSTASLGEGLGHPLACRIAVIIFNIFGHSLAALLTLKRRNLWDHLSQCCEPEVLTPACSPTGQVPRISEAHRQGQIRARLETAGVKA
jgi:hypothetical protein